MTQQSQRLWGHATVVAQARPPSHMYVHQYQRITLEEVVTSLLAAPSLLSPHSPLVPDYWSQCRARRWKTGRAILSTFVFYKCRLHVLLDSEGDRHRSGCSCSGTTACIFTTACLFPTPPPGPALPSRGAAGAGLFGSLDHAGVELGVAAGVLGQVVAPHEPLLAEGAPELFLASVGSVVPCELVRAGELFKAVGPRAGKWSLTCVHPVVRLEVGGLAVDLAAAAVGALVPLLGRQLPLRGGPGGAQAGGRPRRGAAGRAGTLLGGRVAVGARVLVGALHAVTADGGGGQRPVLVQLQQALGDGQQGAVVLPGIAGVAQVPGRLPLARHLQPRRLGHGRAVGDGDQALRRYEVHVRDGRHGAAAPRRQGGLPCALSARPPGRPRRRQPWPARGAGKSGAEEEGGVGGE